MYNPVCTYRLQFNKAFTFKDLERLIPYFQKLGVKTIYASPVFRAVPGSTHGYDSVNPQQINPEIGSTEQLKEIVKSLHDLGMGWLQDIVPNHMAYHYQNPWLGDVLKKGKDSHWASYFDINWQSSGGRLLAPFLGEDPGEALDRGELKLIYEDQEFFLDYKDNRFPLRQSSVEALRRRSADPVKAVLLANDDTTFLKQLVADQEYCLCESRQTERTINYRRFFTVNGLICLNVQKQEVFDDVHKLPLSLLKCGVIDGLRIDHIDGLYDPAGYLQCLRTAVGDEAYLVVEKILSAEEELPRWPVQGCTGYEFLSDVSHVLTCADHEKDFDAFYRELTGETRTVQQQRHDKKREFLFTYMGGELEALVHLFMDEELARGGTVKQEDLRQALAEFLVCCPVYRFYPGRFPLEDQEEEALAEVFRTAGETKRGTEALNLLEDVFLLYPSEQDETYNKKVLHFFRRCMQYTGPLMAKGVEDTLFYTSNWFIAHNEVGDSPGNFGSSIETFHRKMQRRKERWPLALNATATHDTKRGEDARARLSALSCMPEEWFALVKEWNAPHQDSKQVPDANERYFIYQTLTATFPFEAEQLETYEERLMEYIPKVLREAKVHSTWEEPNEDYESQVKQFVKGLLEKRSSFQERFLPFQKKVADIGCMHSLAQLILKFTCPGVPDLYQGAELWDLSLVDPDNRRPVDYEQRRQYLDAYEAAESKEALFKAAWKHKEDGRIKLFLTQRLLELRKKHAGVFAEGDYRPLQTGGSRRDSILAFSRRHKSTWIVVVLPLYLDDAPGDSKKTFHDTYVQLPGEMPEQWQNLVDGGSGRSPAGRILVHELFKELPFAVLELNYKENPRSAGVLLPLSALHAAYGVGDIGVPAAEFLQFLSRGLQTYWQLLPLNPVMESAGHSPYSSSSVFAIDPLYISPEALLKEQWLTEDVLDAATLKETGKIEYEEARVKKEQLCRTAFENFLNTANARLHADFEAFCEAQSYWLHDFALFIQLKQIQKGKPWYQWEEAYKQREPGALHQVEKAHEQELRYTRWQQFILHRQWQKLKSRAEHLGIRLFGDLPFYPAYDSADVWANQPLFSLDEAGKMTGVAGVPPDYFSKSGQLWHTPTFNWDEMKRQHYSWWTERFRRNLELFDLVRIDHFRALAEYWEVPANEKTAVKGEWLEGPGKEFFEVMKSEFGRLPFVAEDLGYHMEKPYELREAVGLPGMKVLQYAFGENFSSGVDIPHNYPLDCVVYTGTHDNNTTRGWFRHEASPAVRQHLQDYTGVKPGEDTCCDQLIHMAYASVARMAIIPMQDLLNKDEKSRFNTPGTKKNNWRWRLKREELSESLEVRLRKLVRFYNRI